MSEETIRREKKTIAGETFDAPNVKYKLDDRKAAFAPPAGSDIVTQDQLEEIAEDEVLLERMRAEIDAKRQAILDRLRAGKCVVEPGTYAASVSTHYKQQRVSWKEAFVQYNGEVEAAKLESAAKGGPKEVSSYSLELKRVDGGKA